MRGFPPPLSQGKSKTVSLETSLENHSLGTERSPDPGLLRSGPSATGRWPCSFQEPVLALVPHLHVFDGSLEALGKHVLLF